MFDPKTKAGQDQIDYVLSNPIKVIAEITPLKAQLAECKKDAERWKMASTSRNFGITNWCEYGQRTSYDSFATKLIDGAIAAQKEKA